MSQKVFTNGTWKQLVHGVPYATEEKAGVIKIGSGLSIQIDGTLDTTNTSYVENLGKTPPAGVPEGGLVFYKNYIGG